MGCSKIFNYNLINQEITNILGVNGNALFPANNIKDAQTTRVYRSTTSTDRIIFDIVSKMSEEDKFLLGKKNSVTLAEFNLYKDTLLGGAVTIEDIPNKEFQKILSKEFSYPEQEDILFFL